jgi:hypothetical protein
MFLAPAAAVAGGIRDLARLVTGRYGTGRAPVPPARVPAALLPR